MSEDFKVTRISLEAAAEQVRRVEESYIYKVDGYVDKGIESNIRPVVIALVAHGFPTQNSCEGHRDGNLYPWVRFEPRAVNATSDGILVHVKSRADLLLHVRQIHCEVEQLSKLLGEFWENDSAQFPDRELEVSPEWDPLMVSDADVVDRYLRIRAERFIALPGYTLQCAGAGTLFRIPSEILEPHRDVILYNRQQDMLRFGDFLVSKL